MKQITTNIVALLIWQPFNSILYNHTINNLDRIQWKFKLPTLEPLNSYRRNWSRQENTQQRRRSNFKIKPTVNVDLRRLSPAQNHCPSTLKQLRGCLKAFWIWKRVIVSLVPPPGEKKPPVGQTHKHVQSVRLRTWRFLVKAWWNRFQQKVPLRGFVTVVRRISGIIKPGANRGRVDWRSENWWCFNVISNQFRLRCPAVKLRGHYGGCTFISCTPTH